MPSKYVKRGETPEGTAKRLMIHRHNSHRGFAAMIHRQAETIVGSESATAQSKLIACEISALAATLIESLKTRKDQTNDTR